MVNSPCFTIYWCCLDKWSKENFGNDSITIWSHRALQNKCRSLINFNAKTFLLNFLHIYVRIVKYHIKYFYSLKSKNIFCMFWYCIPKFFFHSEFVSNYATHMRLTIRNSPWQQWASPPRCCSKLTWDPISPPPPFGTDVRLFPRIF